MPQVGELLIERLSLTPDPAFRSFEVRRVISVIGRQPTRGFTNWLGSLEVEEDWDQAVVIYPSIERSVARKADSSDIRGRSHRLPYSGLNGMTKRFLARIGRTEMNVLRTFLLRYRAMAFAVMALALAVKAIVPAGYMVGAEAKVLTIRICDDTQLSAAAHNALNTRAVVIPMKGEPAGKHSKADGMCSYGALSFAVLAGADPIQLALALLFILAIGFAALAPPAPRSTAHLRPPLRGPPALA